MHTCRIVGSFCSLLAMVLPAVLTILLLVQHRKLSGRFSDPLQPASATHTGTHIHIHTHTHTYTLFKMSGKKHLTKEKAEI